MSIIPTALRRAAATLLATLPFALPLHAQHLSDGFSAYPRIRLGLDAGITHAWWSDRTVQLKILGCGYCSDMTPNGLFSNAGLTTAAVLEYPVSSTNPRLTLELTAGYQHLRIHRIETLDVQMKIPDTSAFADVLIEDDCDASFHYLNLGAALRYDWSAGVYIGGGLQMNLLVHGGFQWTNTILTQQVETNNGTTKEMYYDPQISSDRYSLKKGLASKWISDLAPYITIYLGYDYPWNGHWSIGPRFTIALPLGSTLDGASVPTYALNAALAVRYRL